MPVRASRPARFLGHAALLAAVGAATVGCSVVAVTATAVGVAATGVGLAVDAGVGAARVTGRAIGATADALAPSDDR